MLWRVVMAGPMLLVMTTTVDAGSAVEAKALSQVAASSGSASVGSQERNALELDVEAQDVAISARTLGELGPNHRPSGETASVDALAKAEARSRGQPLVTLFDHLEKPDPRTADEHLTVGVDYRLLEHATLPFEVAESGSLEDREENHNVMLRANLSF